MLFGFEPLGVVGSITNKPTFRQHRRNLQPPLEFLARARSGRAGPNVIKHFLSVIY